MTPEKTGANQPETKAPEELREEIEETREEVGDTVAALAEKSDVKAQARKKAEATKQQVLQNPTPVAVAGGVLALMLLARLIRRRM
jgi:ElaB/YqjD/DUF883 family membrane-anchored ribosome-binding protein